MSSGSGRGRRRGSSRGTGSPLLRALRGPLALALALSPAACKRSASPAHAVAQARAPGLVLDLSLGTDQRTLGVTLRVTGPDVLQVRALRATRGWADTEPLAAVGSIEVTDERGRIGVLAPRDEGAFSVLPLERAPVGDELTLRFVARTGTTASRLALHGGALGVSGVGHGFLLRPAMEATLPLAVQLVTEGLGADATFSTSLDGLSKASVEDLAGAIYVAGPMRSEKLPSGDRVTAALGTSIDGLGALALAGGTLREAERIFGLKQGRTSAPLALFVIGEHGIGKEHDGALTGGALGVWLDASRPLDDGAKILVAHEALHRVFGGELRVGIEGYEATWFSEGFATHYARRTLFDQGLIDAVAFAADVARIDERSEKAGPNDPRAAEYGRGARLAASIDSAVRARSKGARSLDDVVRALAILAAKSPEEPLSVETFRAAVAAETGPEREREIWKGFAGKALPDLPDDAFGPCFQRSREQTTAVSLGFDIASLTGSPQIIHGTVPGSAAARAGVKDGAMILRSNLRPGQDIDPTFTIELTLSAPRGKKTVKYKAGVPRTRTVFKPVSCKR